MVTQPLIFKGNKLVINYSTSAVGYVKVAILNEEGESLSGFGPGEAVEIYGDEIERTVAWKHGTDVAQLAGRPIRLKFVMKDADLYSIQFQP